MRWLFETKASSLALVLRFTLGGVMLPHGAQKLLGFFGGAGFSGTMTAFTEHMHLPAVVAFLVILAESFGSLGLILGFLTRVGAAGIGLVMLGATVLVHRPHGFFMNWFDKQGGEGFEYHLLAMGLALALLITGGGSASVDRVIATRMGGGR